MKLIKVILSILLAFAILWIAVALFSPKYISVKESVTINNSASTVFNQVNNFSNWMNWSAWNQRDSLMEFTYSKPSKGVNASISWKSEQEGDGSQKIVESIPFEKIRIQVFLDEWGENYSNWEFVDQGEFETFVTWTFEDAEIGFLLRPMGFSISNMIKDDYQTSLENLKYYCENEKQQNIKMKPSVIESDSIYYIAKHIVCSFEEIGPQMGMAYGELINICNKNKWTVIDMPFSVNYEMDGDQFVFDAAFKIDKDVEAPNGFVSGFIPSSETATISHYGMYENLPASYKIIEDWIEQNGYMINGNSYEVYITDPGSEPDSSKWETQVFYPVTKIEPTNSSN
jgi:effector-binding domain-containing protein